MCVCMCTHVHVCMCMCVCVRAYVCNVKPNGLFSFDGEFSPCVLLPLGEQAAGAPDCKPGSIPGWYVAPNGLLTRGTNASLDVWPQDRLQALRNSGESAGPGAPASCGTSTSPSLSVLIWAGEKDDRLPWRCVLTTGPTAGPAQFSRAPV